MVSQTKIKLGVVAAPLALAPGAEAASLTVAEVGFPAVNCVFNTIGNVGLGFDSGTALLQSRTFTGAAGTPGRERPAICTAWT